ncbi:cytochrome c oxidase subunit VIIc [Pyrrhoderma noxium]|uniref:Cytochrome c oxidase subunit 8, mitochondrial n=1 Tax=Pyrrhoderma noxium TaxID=2282107 RepID=A0A286UKQ4_9AGAM|nr:cytochrome c oxidase subunit VIIc [Pyrrhoderma noxium]
MSFLRSAPVLPRVAAPSMISRAGMLARRQIRGIHIENSVGHNTPFVYTNKRAFTAGYVGLLSTLFAVPFVAVRYQLWKSGH